MYASEAELNEVKSKLLNSGVLPLDLEAQIEGTFSFRNAGIPSHIYDQIRKAGFVPISRVTIEGRNSEYTIASAAPAQPATADAGADRSMLVFTDIEEANQAVDAANDEIADLQAKLAAAEARADAAVEAHNNLLTLIRKWTYTSMDGFTAVTDDHGEVAAAALQTSAHGKGK